MTSAKTYGLILGNGDLPLQLIQTLQNNDTPFCCVDLAGRDLKQWDLITKKPILQTSVGRVGGILKFFKTNNVTHIVMVGGIRRPNITSLKMDGTGMKWVAKLGVNFLKGDDALLTGVENLLTSHGFAIDGVQSIMPDVLASPDNGVGTLNDQDTLDIQHGIAILKTLSPFDIGQSIIVSNGQVLGIEAVEGTQHLIQRCAQFKTSNPSGFLIKMPKIGQSKTTDLPTVGPQTFLDLKHCGYKGIAIQNKCVQIIDAKSCQKIARDHGLILHVFDI